MNDSLNEVNKANIIINSVDRALDVIEYLFNANAEVSITQISKDLGVYKSTIYRTLLTLQNRGYVRQNPANEKYTLGVKVFVLGSRMDSASEIASIVLPYMQQLNAKYHEACNVSVMDIAYDGTYKSVIIAKIDGQFSLATKTNIGSINECYAAAVGKCLVAFNDVDLSVYEKHPMVKFTDTTITSISKLNEELKKVRDQGYAIDDGEREVGQFCIGAPILKEGKAIAAISISGPKNRFIEEDVEERAQYIKQIAQEISNHFSI